MDSLDLAADDLVIHSIAVWYSRRRRLWCIERLDSDGHQVGLSHACTSRVDALACRDEWLRAHPEAHPIEHETDADRAARRHLPRRHAA